MGGPILDAAFANIGRGARVVICGSISAYDSEETPPGPRNYYNVVKQRAGEAMADLAKWVDEGKIVWEADVQSGFKNAPKTLLRLYSGSNFGKQLLEI